MYAIKPVRVNRLLIFWICILPYLSIAQQGSSYQGLRAGVLDVQITDQRPALLLLTCRIANTGKLDIAPDKTTHSLPENLLVEFDSAALPTILRGLESDIAEGIKRLGLHVRPGEISKRITLVIGLPPAIQIRYYADNPLDCPNLVFDTAWIVRLDNQEFELRYKLKNIGKLTAQVLKRSGARGNNLAVNAYFVSGDKLTNGAILAATAFLEDGLESFDGLVRPGHFLTGTVIVPKEQYTRFAPNIVLELDPYSSVVDCDRTNNTISVIIPW